MGKKQLTILIVAGAVIAILCVALAYVSIYKTGPQAVERDTINSLSSKVFSSIIAYGQVQAIEGRNVTVSNLGDNLTISLIDSAQVYFFEAIGGSAAPVQKKGAFGDIKVGDKVNISVRVLPAGGLEGMVVTILPALASDK